jgi:hypothetical protein
MPLHQRYGVALLLLLNAAGAAASLLTVSKG